VFEQKPFKTSLTASISGLYLHLFKCGGLSVDRVFAKYSNLHVTQGYGNMTMHNESGFHWEYGYCNYDFDFQFTIVRNHFDRLASLQKIFSNRRPEGLSMAYLLEVASWNGCEFDRRRHLASDHEIWRHTRPYSWFPLDKMDAIYRTESLQSDWPVVCEKLGIAETLPKINSCKRVRHYSEFFTDDQVDWVREIYAEDFGRFGFKFMRKQE
jgi:hypothetical protein